MIIYNPPQKKLGPRIISDISLDMLKIPKVIYFNVHIITLEYWNQVIQSFLEDDLINGSDLIQNVGFEKGSQ